MLGGKYADDLPDIDRGFVNSTHSYRKSKAYGGRDAYWDDEAEFHQGHGYNYHGDKEPEKIKHPMISRGNQETADYARGKYHYDSIKNGGKGKWVRKR